MTRGTEALPSVKIIEQELEISERNLSRELAKVDETVISAVDSVIRDLIAKIEALTLIYARQNKRCLTINVTLDV